MSMQIITSNVNLAHEIIKILNHYFPSSQGLLCLPNPSITIDTKYYSCQVSINTSTFDTLHPSSSDPNKVDALLFIFDKHEEVPNLAARLDHWMEMLRPESAMICVNEDQNEENQWKYEQEVVTRQNFIPILYENFYDVGANLPKWTTNSSLLQEQWQERQFFSLLELLETVSWNGAVKKTKLQENVSNAGKQVKKEKKQFEQQEGQLNQEDLEKQMIQFERLMQQMMEVKVSTSGDRKQKAEELILKLSRALGQ